MKCARYYGFRNIQNLVRKLKPPKQSRLPGAARRNASSATGGSDYAYVEVMACPGGCTNGGGQIRVEDVAAVLPQTRGEAVVNMASPQSQKEWLRRVDEAYFSADSDTDTDDGEHGGDVAMTNGSEHTDCARINGSGLSQPPTHVINGIDVLQVHEFLSHWSGLVGVPLEKLVYTAYRRVDSDVGKNKPNGKGLNDTERIAQIAGLTGGGW